MTSHPAHPHLLTFVSCLLVGCSSAEPPPPATAEPAGEHHELSAREGHEGHEGHEAHEAEAARGEPQPSSTLPDGSRVYGAALDSARPVTPLAQIVASPSRFGGQTVKTEGEIARVCQRMGCWMELRGPTDAAHVVRVPMAGHAFFLPRNVAGRHATIQGQVELRQLSADEAAHLRSEGAQATSQELSIHATGVAVR